MPILSMIIISGERPEGRPSRAIWRGGEGMAGTNQPGEGRQEQPTQGTLNKEPHLTRQGREVRCQREGRAKQREEDKQTETPNPKGGRKRKRKASNQTKENQINWK